MLEEIYVQEMNIHDNNL